MKVHKVIKEILYSRLDCDISLRSDSLLWVDIGSYTILNEEKMKHSNALLQQRIGMVTNSIERMNL